MLYNVQTSLNQSSKNLIKLSQQRPILFTSLHQLSLTPVFPSLLHYRWWLLWKCSSSLSKTLDNFSLRKHDMFIHVACAFDNRSLIIATDAVLQRIRWFLNCVVASFTWVIQDRTECPLTLNCRVRVDLWRGSWVWPKARDQRRPSLCHHRCLSKQGCHLLLFFLNKHSEFTKDGFQLSWTVFPTLIQQFDLCVCWLNALCIESGSHSVIFCYSVLCFCICSSFVLITGQLDHIV